MNTFNSIEISFEDRIADWDENLQGIAPHSGPSMGPCETQSGACGRLGEEPSSVSY